MPDNTQRYVEVTSRLNTVAGIGASVITLLLLVATWGDWVPFSVLLGVQVALIPFNAWVSLRLLQRWGVTRAELLRTSVNLGAMLVSSLVAGWPFPVWFWMIFVALVFDQFGARVYWTVLLSFIVVECVAGLIFGAPWLHPVCFAVFALICSQISSARVGVIRHMLV
ncbi:MAG TPA: hypothetical protein VNO33_00085, partial [Kofleriaceae bacterium]|nr:hypothetical protein [Kofleriaceae bacterium]